MADEQEDVFLAKWGRDGIERGTKKYAKHLVRVSTKKHVSYPKKICGSVSYAYWHGVQVLMDEHRSICMLEKGDTVIFCGDSGSGKSKSVNAMVHGEFGL
jgi:type IV secretory pathway ATPase VirB11/archaellum biosynthesis ATPase